MFFIVSVALQPSICVTLHGLDEVEGEEDEYCAALKPTRAHRKSLLQIEDISPSDNEFTISAPAHTPPLYTTTTSIATTTKFSRSNEMSSSEGAQQTLPHKHLSSPSTATSRLACRLL